MNNPVPAKSMRGWILGRIAGIVWRGWPCGAILASVPEACDVLVIGGGAAGVAAALAASARRSVTLVRPAPGVTALGTGAWLGSLHPPLRDALASVGYDFRDVSAPLPHPNGHTITCELAAVPQSAAQLDGDTLVCGIAGLPGFHARALARMWSGGAADLRSTVMSIPGTPAAGWSPVSLARVIDTDASMARAVADALRAIAAREHAPRIVVPAVFGTSSESRLITELFEGDGIAVGEALGVPPSLPGWRLDRALLMTLERAGVRVINARAVEAVVAGRTVSSVRFVSTGDGTAAFSSSFDSISARHIVLASGKYAGGGLEADPAMREAALGCPVWIEHLGDVFDVATQLVVTMERTASQPLLEAGVRCNESGNPLDRFGDVFYDNVIVAGSIRAGADAMSLGSASADGWSAGERAAEAA